MKKVLFLQSLACLLLVSCSINELDTNDRIQLGDDIFYASLESYSDPDTRVYVDENIKILWDADDRITIFNKYTYNQEYRFAGATGDNAGAFKKVPNDDFVTGNDMDFICSVYPYIESTSISNKGVLSLNLPAEQAYREGSFGPGANTMVSATEDNQLKFKNVGGYLVLKFYGEGVSVSSIKLEGNNGEKLSGAATVKPAVGVIPNITMASTAGSSITITCDEPIELGATKEEATQFWMVVPPTKFTQGFKLTVTDPNGNEFVKETSANLSIARNGVLRISPIEVVLPEPSEPNNVIYYTSTDGNVVTPYATDVFGANIISNEYVDGRGVITFDRNVTSIGNLAFYSQKTLESITIPNSVAEIGPSAFQFCSSLSSVIIPDSVIQIGRLAFYACGGLVEIILGKSVLSIGEQTFDSCTNLTSVLFSDSLVSIGEKAFWNCTRLTSIDLPNSLERIDSYAFRRCSSLTSMFIPASVKTIGQGVLTETNVLSLSVSQDNPNYDSREDCNAIIESSTNTLISGCKNTIIPNSIKTIGVGAFAYVKIATINLPNAIEIIDDYAFQYCSTLSSIVLPDSVTTIGKDAFSDCINLNEIVFGDSLSEIGENAFCRCSSLSNLSFSSLEIIGDSAFMNCTGLSTVILPDSIKAIGQRSFNRCSSLSSITVFAAIPPTKGAYMFDSTNNCPIFVPTNCVDAYKTAWMSYEDRIYAIPSGFVSFADDSFKAYCVENFDKDGDGEVSYEEAELVTRIDVNTDNITSLEGIEYFSRLQTLFCCGESYDYESCIGSGQLISLDVSKNTALVYLECSWNRLISLDVSGCTALIRLVCGGNQLSDLDVGDCTALETLMFEDNLISSLDVSNNTALKRLSCSSNQLTSLDVSDNTALISLFCNYNQLTSLDVSNNTALTTLNCWSNQLTSVDVSFNTALTTLNCGYNKLTSLDVSNNTALTSLQCHYNKLKSLDVSNNTALTLLWCNDNPYLKEIWLKTGQTISSFSYDKNIATIKYKD